MYQKQGRQ